MAAPPRSTSPAGAGAAAAAGVAGVAPLSTSALRMRPRGPVPWTVVRSIPRAAAMRRATGEALTSPAGGVALGAGPGPGVVAAGLGAGVRAGAPLLGAKRASTCPASTVSPADTKVSSRVPAAGAGTSASTLSVEISTTVSSAATGSPGAFSHSRTVPSDTDSPIWGITMSTVSPVPGTPPFPASASVGAAADAAPLAGAISASSAPTSIVSPAWAWILTSVPLAGAGTSASTLSVDTSTIVSSAETASPSCFTHSSTVPSDTDSPICGRVTSTVVSTEAMCGPHDIAGSAARLPDEPRRAREGPDASDHADQHGQRERHDAPPVGRQHEQRHDDPPDPVYPAQRGRGGLERRDHEREQEREVDGRVQERQRLQAPEGQDAEERGFGRVCAHRSASSAAMRRSGSSASAGQVATSAGHQANASCSSSGTTSAPAGSRASPTSMTRLVGRRASAS